MNVRFHPDAQAEFDDAIDFLEEREIGLGVGFASDVSWTPKTGQRALIAVESLERSGRSVLLATGKLIGEGFDHPRLDTLFLTFPVSWKGIVYQYVGRLHRSHTGKVEARVYDYVDSQVPVLAASFRRRMKSYDRMGYVVHDR